MADRPTQFHHSSKLYPNLDDEFKKSVNQPSVNQRTYQNYKQPIYGYSATDSTRLRNRTLNEENSKLSDDEEDDDDESDCAEAVPAPERAKSSTDGGPNLCVTISILLLLAIAVVFASKFIFVPKNDIKSPLGVLDAAKAEELYDLENQFPTQSQNLWTTIVSGVKNLYSSDPKQPCVLLLLLNEDDASDKSLQQETGECIARLVAKRVVNHVNTESGPAVVDASSVTASDYGDTLQFLTNKISSQKALVITNLQELSGSVAQSLHVLCDRYNPMVRDALVVFTLKSKQRGTDENVASFVQRTLTKLWEKDVPPDKLPALVTRISGSVVSVITEKNLPNDCI